MTAPRASCPTDPNSPALFFWWIDKVLADSGVKLSPGGPSDVEKLFHVLALIKKDWTFKTGPFTATWHDAGNAPGAHKRGNVGVVSTADLSDESHQVEIDLTLTHTPQ